MNNLDWLFKLKRRVPLFLKKIKGKKRKGFYHYSLSGDYFDESVKWGLGNAVFALKIYYILGFGEKYGKEIKDTIKFIKAFQKKDGYFYDSLVKNLSFPVRIFSFIKDGKFSNLTYDQTKIAETRQAISALGLFNEKPSYEFKDFPKSHNEIEAYLSSLDWSKPWDAGSHFSHLLFFIKYNNLKNKNSLIDQAIKWVNCIQRDDGAWYIGKPSLQQKINGAMKVITGLKTVNKINFKRAERLIDLCLRTIDGIHACDNFNIIYILRYASELTNNKYRNIEIKKFVLDRLKIYKSFYFINLGGFSFFPKKANKFYYGAPISKGKNEPDVHGTVMFLWGISVIAQILRINNRLRFKEHVP